MEKLKRKSGILCHITSLPNKFGLGTFSCECYNFINFLRDGGFSVWQVLPFAECGYGLSPYSAISSFAINKYLIDLTEFLTEEEMNSFGFDKYNRSSLVSLAEEQTKFDKALDLVYFKYGNSFDRLKFNKYQAYWLDDYATYMVATKQFGSDWTEWPVNMKNKVKADITKFQLIHSLEIDKEKFFQYIADMQWKKIQKYAKSCGIEIFGDIPMYVELLSVDVWANQKDWQIENGKCKLVAGVPGDYFNPDGQLWGYPLYNYTNMAKNKYSFWANRMKRMSELFDIVRIDHFVAISKYYAIPQGKNANSGKWMTGAKDKLLSVIVSNCKGKLVAEDLGNVTEDVIRLREKFGISGIRVMQFGFDNELDSEHKPHNYDCDTYAYLGTHDNDTFMGMLGNSDWDKINRFKRYVGIPLEYDNYATTDKVVETLYRSSAKTIILTMQDVLKLGSESRMNIPGVPEGNWQWQLENIDMGYCERYRYLSDIYNRK